MKKIIMLFTVTAIVVFVTGCSIFFTQSEEQSEEWESYFQLPVDCLRTQSINSSFDTVLTSRGFDVASLRQKEFPVGLFVGWGNYRSDCNIRVASGQGIAFCTPTKLSLLGNFQAVDNYRFKITCRVSGTGSLTLGFYGIGAWENKMQTKQYSFSNAENEVVEYCLPVFNQFSSVRIEVGIEGDLVLSQLECYRQPLADVSVVEGTIEEISTAPDPTTAAYPDCYITAKYRVNQILKGEPVKRDVQLLLPAFMDRKLTPYAKIRPREKWNFSLVPFERLPENLKSINQADNLQLFELDPYYVEHANLLNKFTDIYSGINFSDTSTIDYVSIFKRKLNPMPSPDAEKDRAFLMEKDLKKLNQAIASIEGNRDELNARFARSWNAKQNEYNRLNEKLIWGRMADSFWALPVNYQLIPPELKITEQNLAALKSYQDMYHANGIHFIIQIIPDFYDISARVMNPEFRDVPDYQSAIIAKQLLEAGIEAMYMSEALIAGFNRHPLMFFYPDNGHPADGCQDILTDALIQRLGRFPEITSGNLRHEDFSVLEKPTVYGPLVTWPKNCDIGTNQPGSTLLCHHILYKDKELQSNDDSPILIIGNSYIQTPTTENPYSAYLASKLLLMPQTFRVSGWGAFTSIPVSIFMNTETYLKGKKVVVFPIGSLHLNSSYPFVNIRQLDENRLQLNGKVNVGQLELNESSYDFPLNGFSSTDPFQVRWKTALANSKSYKLPQPGCFLLDKYLLPDFWDSAKEGMLAITAMASHDQNIDVKVNDRVISAIPYATEPQWTTLFFPLPAQTKTVKVEVITEKPDTFFAIKSMKLYQ